MTGDCNMYNDTSRLTPAARLALFIGGALLLIVPMGCSLGGSTEASATGAKGKRPAPLVRVAKIEKRRVSPKLKVVGSVLPRRTSIVASGADGLVEEFPAEAGAYVKKNEVLCKLRVKSTDLAIKEAEAMLRERQRRLDELTNGSRVEEKAEAEAKRLAAVAVVKNARSKLIRARRLFREQANNQEDLDDASERVDAAEQVLAAVTAVAARVNSGPRVEEIEQASARTDAQQERVNWMQAEKGKRITKAPFDGYISETHSYVGQWLSKGDSVLTLSLLDVVDVVAKVDQADLHYVRLGEKVDFFVDGHSEIWQGTIVQIIPRSDWMSGSRGFPVVVRLKNRFTNIDGRRRPVLKEGMMAEMTFLGNDIEALMVPKDALVRTSRGTHIFVVTRKMAQGESDSGSEPKPPTTFKIEVTTGISDGTYIQVIGKSIEAGQDVVIEGAERLQPFQVVQLVTNGTTEANDTNTNHSKTNGPTPESNKHK